MNQHLQSILNIVQRDESLTVEEKNAIIQSLKSADKELEITVFKLDRTEKVKKTTAILLEETIEELEQKRKAVEAQNRELEIESSLERVRTEAMGMRKADDLLNICKIIFKELVSLGFTELRNALIHTFVDQQDYFIDYDYSDFFGGKITRIPCSGNSMIERFIKEIRKSNDAFMEVIVTGTELDEWREFRKAGGQIDDPRLNNASSVYYYYYSIEAGDIGISAFSPISEVQRTILKRFRNVFDFAYRRYTDIEKAEAQAREAQIQLSLERVRARTMAMQSSNELPQAANLLFEQVQSLDMPAWSAGYCIWDDDKKGITLWMSSEGVMQPSFHAPLTEDPSFIHMREAHERGEVFHVEAVGGEELVRHYQYMRTLPGIGEILDSIIDAGHPLPTFQIFHCIYFSQGFLLFITYEPVTEAHEIFKRFGKVFEQTYTRFLDLKKAEAQAKEAQIEAALEKVRSRSLAMHQSNELQEVANTLFERLNELNVKVDSANIVIFEEGKRDFNFWVASNYQKGMESFYIPYSDLLITKDLVAARESGTPFFGKSYSFEEKNEWFDHAFENTAFKFLSEERKQMILGAKAVTISIAFSKHTGIQVTNYSDKLLLEEKIEILKRFSKVFEQAYTRFLDLQKAEAQAREAQIELGLERVRARAMAMQKSHELKELIATVSTELGKLDIVLDRCFIMTYDPRSNDSTWWMANPETPSEPVGLLVQYHEHPAYLALLKAWHERTLKSEYILEGKTKKTWDKFLFRETELSKLPVLVSENMQAKNKVYISSSYNNFGSLTLATLEPLLNEQFDIMLRFAKVFDLTYTRFNDLKQAEAQAREAQIQLGLERVRARAMAMQNSEELNALIGTVFVELTKLDLQLTRCVIIIFNAKTNSCRWWMANSEAPETPMNFFVKYHEHPPYLAYLKAWRKRQLNWEYVIEGRIKTDWDDFLFSETELSLLPDFVIAGMRSPERVYLNASFNNFGNLTLATLEPLSNEHSDILLRFAKVFDLTYTRFNDLKQAEVQAREAKIEASLERVRSKAMSMHSSQDLANTIAVFYHELELFSITPRRCGVGLLNKETRIAELSTMNTTEQGKSIEIIGKIKMESHPVLEGVYDNWLLQKEFHPVLRGNEIRDYYQLLKPQIAFPEYPHDAVQYGYFFFFPEGGVYAWTNKEMEEDELLIYRRFTSVLSLTYKRYKDLQQAEDLAHKAEQDLVLLKEEKKRTEDALTELKITQKQLIQSEKMASLGELTAGIAHEIQNPLNFVNNFSDLSNELLAEMIIELDKGDVDGAKAIANDVKQNLEKIDYHGKRADAIVKGMLQHSRSNSATKEPTDINKLADEYLRLAFHGLRAKDNFFNTALKTNYDNSIGSINIIPQDIGRVLLNLITNAFYAVTEKKKQVGNEFEPSVSVTTKKDGNKIDVIVGDNGNGIPEKLLDKIFQPFFTTKPTGQGTGLGLSLSYDIVKAHGGEIKVETKEGVGSKFIIELNS